MDAEGDCFFVYREIPIDENDLREIGNKSLFLDSIALGQNIFVCPAPERDKQKLFSVLPVSQW